MLKHILEYEIFRLLEDDFGGTPDKPEKLKIKVDKETGEDVMDKSKIPPDVQIRVLCKELYKATIDSGRYQSIMNDKIAKLQQAGAGEAEIGQIQQVMQDQMQGLQMRAMDLEMYIMSVGGTNQQLSMMSQKLTGEAKMLADKANKEYFDKKAKKVESDVLKGLKQKQEEEMKKQQQEEQSKSKGDEKHDGKGDDKK